MDNMKTANIAIFMGVLVCSLLSGRSPLHAQTINTPVTVEGDDKPWNQGVPRESREVARSLFLEGNKLFYLPVYTQAVEKYIAALAKWKHPAFYFNLALAQLNLGRELEAHENLQKAVQQGEEPLGAIPFQEARKQLEDLERQLGRLRVTCSTAGAEVTLDGAPLFTGPGNHEEWVKAKTYEITAKRPNYLSKTSRVTVSRGELKTLDLQLITLNDAKETRWAVWKPWAVVGVGAAVAAGGGVLHALSSMGFRTFDNKFLQLDCATNMSDPKLLGCATQDIPQDLNRRLTLARREQQIAKGSYIAGGALITTGAVLLYMNRPRLPENRITNSPAEDSVSITPTLSSNMLGILVSVSH